MINYQEIFKIFEFNNITKTSPTKIVSEALGHMNYSEADQREALRFLKSQGWMPDSDNVFDLSEKTVPPAAAAAPEVQPVATPVQQPAAPVMPVVAEAAPAVSRIERPVAAVIQPISPALPAVVAASDSAVSEAVPAIEAVGPVSQIEQPTEIVNKAAMPKRKGSKKLLAILLVLAAIAGVGVGLVFAYIQKIGPFAFSGYTEDNFFSGILAKSDLINTASYKIAGTLEVVDRDEGAEPFSVKEASNAAQLRKQYENDSTRIENASAVIRELNDLADYSTYSGFGQETGSYPESLDKLTEQDAGSRYSYYGNSIKDPVTGKVYDYAATDGGKNFALTINFETDYALQAVNGYDYGDDEEDEDAAPDTIINGRKVTFTKDSSSYMYMSNEPPKPFLVSLSDSLRLLSPDVRVTSSVSASSETKSDVMPDWMFNVNAEGDFGDLSYKVNADALKKENTYYFKVNNFPSLFLGSDLGLVKGKWISIVPEAPSDKKDDSGNSFSLLSMLKENISKAEESFKENREKSIKLTKKMVTIADEENLIAFRAKPKTEKVDGRQLIKYDLSIRKEAILPFYIRLQEEINNDPDFEEYRDSIDQGLIDYLKSEEFDQVFNYFDENNSFVVWTDTKGFPAMAQNTLRIVPPDTATQLKGKQINIVFEWSINDINKELDIQAPSDAVSIDELISDYEKNLEDGGYDY